jgi:uncharacterized protein (DUF2236 family)
VADFLLGFHRAVVTMKGQFFSPDSVIWRVDREMVLLLAGGRALLMQIAHPKVAAGVAEHSHFQKDPLRRLRQTMSAMWSVVFDDVEQARRSLGRVKEIHGIVRGEIPHPDGKRALSYSALEPELLLWVHATLVDSALLAYEHFVAPLPAVDKSQYYDDTKKLATLFDVPPAALPRSLEDFHSYIDRMLQGPDIVVSATAQSLAREILYPRPWVLRPGRPLFAFMTAGLLPAKLRHAYDLRWDRQRQWWFDHFASLTRAVLPCLPPLVRTVPHARAAQKRLRGSRN